MTPNRIIVRAPNWIGDQVMAMEFYQSLRAHYPKAHITWLLKESLQSLSTYGLADEVLLLPQTAKALALKKFDLAISLPATLRATVLFFSARIPNRVGFSQDGNELFLTAHKKWEGRKTKKHKADLYLELFEFISSHKPTKRLRPTSSQERQKKIVIAPGASIRLREWPYYEALTDKILEAYPEYSLSFVGASESEAWHEILKNKKRVTDLIGKTSLEELRKECESAALVIANDSGTAHIAATLAEAKTLVLFGPGDPNYIAPRGEVYPVRLEGLPCSPCEKPYCQAPYGYQACLRNLKVETVFSKVAKALN